MEIPRKKIIFVRSLGLCIGLVALFVFIGVQYGAAPKDFPVPYELHIERGQTLFSISNELARDRVIRSPRLFEMWMIVFGSERTVSEGQYYFASPLSVFEVAMRISGHQFGIERTKITFPEGFTVNDMAMRLGATFPMFDVALFQSLAKQYEGFLFPDTYKFFPRVTPEIVIRTLQQNFVTKTLPLQDEIQNSKRTEKDIIIMASIIEKEANGADDRGVIAGILWKRIDQNMPLQVDAPFLFLLGKASKDITRADLAIQSPYNTYINKGLPPTPINNPGIAAITAALTPIASPYLFYLHDENGQIHYASTYAEHKKNIARYLD